MVEVFKTNVVDQQVADEILIDIHKRFANYKANFDLDDCDHILRISCQNLAVDSSAIILLLQKRGWFSELLSDDIQVFNNYDALQSL